MDNGFPTEIPALSVYERPLSDNSAEQKTPDFDTMATQARAEALKAREKPESLGSVVIDASNRFGDTKAANKATSVPDVETLKVHQWRDSREVYATEKPLGDDIIRLRDAVIRLRDAA